MEYIRIKNTDLNVSRICMGGCPLGEYGWGESNRTLLQDTVKKALECGINFFDTADTYGLGQSEINLGQALGNKRKDVIIESKFGVRIIDGKTIYDNSPDYIRTALDASLKRIGTNYLDLYLIHYRDDKTPLSIVVDTLDELKKEGKIRYYGLSNIFEQDKDEIEKYKDKFVCFQNEYSLATRKNENIIFEYAKYMTPMTWGSLGQGILTGKYDANVKFPSNDRRSRDAYVNFHGDKLIKNLKIVESMKSIALKHNVSIASVAIRFVLDYLNNSVAIVGAKSPSQIVGSSQASGWHLSVDEIEQLIKVSE